MRNAVQTNIVVRQVLDTPSVSCWQLHHFALQPPLGRIASHGLAPWYCHGLVVGADPGRKALVGHLPRDIAVDGRDELVVEMFLFAIRTRENGIYPFGKLELVEAPWRK